MLKRLLPLLALPAMFAAVTGCTTIPVDQRADVRQEVVHKTEGALEAFRSSNSDLRAELDAAPGFIVSTGTDVLYGLLSRGDSIGVLYDQVNSTRTFLNIDEFGIGLGIGGTDVELLVILKTVETVENFKKGRWVPSGDLLSISGNSSELGLWSNEEMSVWVRSKSGAEIGATMRLARFSINTELTDTGIATAGIPNIGAPSSDSQGEDAPRVWTRTLPFLGQKVVDKGYDLPLPIGLGTTYVDIQQDLNLTNLSVAFGDDELTPLDFVSFDNSNSDTRSYQIKLDAWVLPFLNVFGLYGKVVGDANLNISLDGNLLLEQIGTDCSRPIVQPPLCNTLEDQIIRFPVQAKVDIETYGVGTILAGGWKGWFATIPASVTNAKSSGKIIDGLSITVTPRIGRLVDLGNRGSLAVFAGGNYLDSELTIDGSFTFPGDNVTLQYRLDQENKDRWNLVAGFNWTFNKRLSWSAEYNGFTGSREAWITSFNARF